MSQIGEKVAIKYARALLDSFADNDLSKVESALQNLAEIWRGSHEIREALLSPLTSGSERSLALHDIGKQVASAHGVSATDHLGRFLNLLDGNRRLVGLPEVSAAFSQLLRQLRRELRVEVVSARPLGDDEKTQLENEVKKAATPLGRASFTSVVWSIDESLLGGMVVRCGDKEVDGSVRGAMNNARAALIS